MFEKHVRFSLLSGGMFLLLASLACAEEAPVGKGDLIVVTAERADVKSEDTVVATVIKGQQFKVIDVNGEWIAIKVGSATGWVQRSDVAHASAPKAPGSAPRAPKAPALEKPAFQRWALVIGCDKYINIRKLKYAGDDARALAEQLTASGFPKDQVTLLHDKAEDNKYRPFRENIEREIDQVLGLPNQGDLVVVAFSGHGVRVDDKDCWCPLDTRLQRLKETTITTESVYRRLQRSKASLKLMIVDACRSDIVPEGSKAPTDAGLGDYGATKEPPPEGIMLLSSCGVRQQSQEDAALGHGVFMHFLLEGMRGKAANEEGGVTLLRLADYASLNTKKYVHDKLSDFQTPALDGHIDGPFEFCPASQNKLYLASENEAITNSIGTKFI